MFSSDRSKRGAQRRERTRHQALMHLDDVEDAAVRVGALEVGHDLRDRRLGAAEVEAAVPAQEPVPHCMRDGRRAAGRACRGAAG